MATCMYHPRADIYRGSYCYACWSAMEAGQTESRGIGGRGEGTQPGSGEAPDGAPRVVGCMYHPDQLAVKAGLCLTCLVQLEASMPGQDGAGDDQRDGASEPGLWLGTEAQPGCMYHPDQDVVANGLCIACCQQLAAQDPTTAHEDGGSFEAASWNICAGNFGERAAVEALAARGHEILAYKPDVDGTNQGGFDIVTLYDGRLYLVDNKAYRSGEAVASVSALTTNLGQNVLRLGAELADMLDDPRRTDAERTVIASALERLEQGDVVLAVTNAAIYAEGRSASGVTERLKTEHGIKFINLMDDVPDDA